MKLTTSGRRKLTIIFAGEEKRFMHVWVVIDLV
jgi:hypothetical protein